MRQITLSEVQPGLTIKGIYALNEDLTILFTDDTFVNVVAVGGEFPYLRDDDVDLECKSYLVRDAERFIELGILDREKYEALERQYTERHEARNREYKLQQYQQLKRELGL